MEVSDFNQAFRSSVYGFLEALGSGVSESTATAPSTNASIRINLPACMIRLGFGGILCYSCSRDCKRIVMLIILII